MQIGIMPCIHDHITCLSRFDVIVYVGLRCVLT
jgi:hypothetical protein